MKFYQYRDNAWLTRKYAIEQLSMGNIAKECGVRTSTIADWIKKHRIFKRTLSETAMLTRDHKITYGPHNANATYRSMRWLREKRFKEGLTLKEIGELCGASNTTIQRWLKKYELDSGRPVQGRTVIVASFAMPRYMKKGLKEFCKRKRIAQSALIRNLVVEAMVKDGFDLYRSPKTENDSGSEEPE